MSAALYFVLLLCNITGFLNRSKRPKLSNPQIHVKLPLRLEVTFGMFTRIQQKTTGMSLAVFLCTCTNRVIISLVLSAVCF